MSAIEDRIVSLKFDNSQFEHKIAGTLASLDAMSEKIRVLGAGTGFADMSRAADSVNLSNMAQGVEKVSSKFTAMGAIAFTAIQRITNGAISFVKKIAKEDILGPIITGGRTRALNIEQAQFMFRGLGINVAEGMKSALGAVRGTAFGLDEAAKAAAQFGASGIKVGAEMTGALRGVAGAAAMTGSSFTEMADIFAGSAGSGKVNNMDLQQFATRGLNAAAAIGKVMNKTEAEIHQMAASGNLDFKTFATAMDKAFGKHATKANETYAGALKNVRAAMSRLGASFFLGHLTQQRDIFNALGPAIDEVASALKPLIQTLLAIKGIGTKKLVTFIDDIDFTNFMLGMWDITHGVQDLYNRFTEVARAIQEAFRDIFPKSAGSNFLKFTAAFRDFISNIKIGSETADKIKRAFSGFFSVIAIGIEIVKGIFTVVGAVIKAIAPAGSGFLNLAASAGDFVTNLKKVLVDGGKIHDFFTRLAELVVVPINFIKELKDRIVDFFSIGVGGDVVSNTFERIETRVNAASSAFDKIKAAFQRFTNFLEPLWTYIKTWFSELGDKIAEAIHPGDFDAAVDVVNVGLVGGIFVMLKKFFTGGVKFGFGGGFLNKVEMSLRGLTASMKAMQTSLKAQAMLKIAAAIGIMVASVVVLSLIDSKALAKALTAMTVGFTQLMGTMILLDNAVGSIGGAAKLGIIGTALILLAAAMVILAVAIKILSSLKLGDLAKGLVGIGVGLGLFVAAVNLIPANTVGLVAAGVSMIAIAVALNVLAIAVKQFAKMDWGELGKGLLAVAVGLVMITLALRAMPEEGALSGLGFIAVAIGLNILAVAVKSFAKMSWGEMLKGFVGVGVGLLIIAGAMKLMPPEMIASALGLVVVAVALNILAKAVETMGKNDMGTLAKGIGAFAVMLLVIAIAMKAMVDALPGAAALLIVAFAMTVLAKVLETVGNLDTGVIVKGILGMAAAIVVLAIAAALIEPVLGAMLAMGAALTLIGAGFAFIGLGVMFLAKGFEIMGTSGAKGAQGIVDALKVLVTAVPQVESALIHFILNFITDMLKAAPLIIRLVEALLIQLLDTVIKLAPKIGKALGVIITEFLKLVREKFPDIVATGFAMLIAFMSGLRDNIAQIATLAADIFINFVDALTLKLPGMIDSVYNFITALIIGVIVKLAQIQLLLLPLGKKLFGGFLTGIVQKAPAVFNFFKGLPGKIISIMGTLLTKLLPKGVQLITGFLNGVKNKALDLFWWFAALPGKIISWLGDGLTSLVNVGKNIIVGLWNGIIDKAKTWLKDKFGLLFGLIPDWVKKILKISSPSKIFRDMGNNVMVGFISGVNDKILDTKKAMSGAANNVTDSFTPDGKLMGDRTTDTINSVLKAITNKLGDLEEFNPVITPVLDLTRVKVAAGDLDSLMKKATIAPTVSLGQARTIATTTELTRREDAAPASKGETTLKFEQIINAPRALSTNDIYKNTKSQITRAKEELGI